jgi:uncharacterized protein YlxW (UPF0749 family)
MTDPQPSDARRPDSGNTDSGTTDAPDTDVRLDHEHDTGQAGTADVSTRAAWRRIRSAFVARPDRAHIAAATILGVLGFMTVVQLQTAASNNDYVSASRPQLIQILDGLNQRSSRLQDEISSLEAEQRDLESGATSDRAAADAAAKRAKTLGVLAGTVPASGPGIQLTIYDHDNQVSAALLLNTIEELRDAGAEAIEINSQWRVIASTSFTDAGDGIVVDGQTLVSPYVIAVIGDPATLATAMRIPGGVEDEVSQIGGSVNVAQVDRIDVKVVHALSTPRYAKPTPGSP